MRQWSLLLGGLVVWAAHFFSAYVFASLFPGSNTARWLTLAATVAALGAIGVIIRRTLRPGSGEFDRWVRELGAIGAALSFVAVLWQGLPAILA